MATKETQGTEDVSFMQDYAGAGLDTIGAGESAVAYLGLVQPDSTVQDADNPAGTWRNSATGRNYGNAVKVIVLAFRTVWSEREGVEPFRTVARYAPGTVEVEKRNPPAGKRGYPKMYSKDTGNEIKELYMYAVMLPDFPEDGIVFFNPNVSSMRACKSWNSQLKGQILPNGMQAPIFGYQWILTSELVPNPQQKSKDIAIFSKVIRDNLTTKDLFETAIKPQLTSVNQAVLQITSGEMPEENED